MQNITNAFKQKKTLSPKAASLRRYQELFIVQRSICLSMNFYRASYNKELDLYFDIQIL